MLAQDTANDSSWEIDYYITICGPGMAWHLNAHSLFILQNWSPHPPPPPPVHKKFPEAGLPGMHPYYVLCKCSQNPVPTTIAKYKLVFRTLTNSYIWIFRLLYRLEGRCVETPNEDPTENEQVEMHDASLSNKQGHSDSNHVENSGVNSAYLMALPHRRIYPTLPDDIWHVADVGDTSVKQKKSTIAVQHAHVGENGANLQGRSLSSPGSTSAFMTAALSVSDHDDDAGLETVLQNPDASNGLTRKSLMHAKQFQGSQQILSPTVPVNYAIQQLSEGKKDPATIRKELAEMYSERVDEVSVHDKVASSRSEGRKQQLGPVPSSVAKKPCTGVQS